MSRVREGQNKRQGNGRENSLEEEQGVSPNEEPPAIFLQALICLGHDIEQPDV
jgi:hypothetical protein